MKKRIIYIAVSLLLVVTAIVGCIYLAIKDNIQYDIRNIEEGWAIKVGKSEMKNVNLKEFNIGASHSSDEIVATKKLISKKDDMVYPIINIKTSDSLFDVYIDGEKIAGNYYGQRGRYLSIKRNIKVSLPKEYDGKILEIRFDTKQVDSDSLINDIHIMSESDYMFNEIRSNFINYIVGTIIIILGLILMVSVLCIPNKTSIIKRLFLVGALFFIAGFGLYAKYNIIDLYTSNSRIIENIEFSALYLCMPIVILISYDIFKNERIRKMLSRLTTVLSVGYIVMLLLINTGIILYQYAINISIVLVIIVSLLLLIISIYNYKIVTNIEKAFIVGMSINYVISMLIILFSKMIVTSKWDKVNNVGILLIISIYFITMVVYYAFMVRKYLNNITEQKVLSELAYTDALTGINNRTKYESFLEELIEGDKPNSILVASFDLNNLKKVNDKNGHEAGDFYIKTFSKTFRKIFEQHGFIGRIGGDEFITIIIDKNIDLKKLISKMETKFDEHIKNSAIDIEASFSYGYSNNKEDKENDIYKLIKLADKRMYKFKVASKKGRK